jgi:ribonuclease HI
MIQTNSDGGARGNPGPAAIGLIIREEDKILKEYKEFIGETTNNVAEYKALIKTLELALEFRNKEIICYLDSELVVKQVKGEYRVKDEKMIFLFSKVKELEKRFHNINYKHVSRWNKYQQIADKLLNEELDKKIKTVKK